MENASKALIIVSEVFIALIILATMAYLFVQFGQFSRNMHEKLAETEIAKVNNHFFTVQGRCNITPQEIASIINYAKKMNDERNIEYNQRSNYASFTTVIIDNKDFFSNRDYINDENNYNNNFENKVNDFLKANIGNFYSCGVDISGKGADGNLILKYDDYDSSIETDPDTGLVTKIKLKKIDDRWYNDL